MSTGSEDLSLYELLFFLVVWLSLSYALFTSLLLPLEQLPIYCAGILLALCKFCFRFLAYSHRMAIAGLFFFGLRSDPEPTYTDYAWILFWMLMPGFLSLLDSRPRPRVFERLPVEILEKIFKEVNIEPGRLHKGVNFGSVFQINSLSRAVALRVVFPRYQHRIGIKMETTVVNSPLLSTKVHDIFEQGIIHKPTKLCGRISNVLLKIVLDEDDWYYQCILAFLTAVKPYGIVADCHLTIVVYTPGPRVSTSLPWFEEGLKKFLVAWWPAHRLTWDLYNIPWEGECTYGLYKMSNQTPAIATLIQPDAAAPLIAALDKPSLNTSWRRFVWSDTKSDVKNSAPDINAGDSSVDASPEVARYTGPIRIAPHNGKIFT